MASKRLDHRSTSFFSKNVNPLLILSAEPYALEHSFGSITATHSTTFSPTTCFSSV